MTVPLTRSSLLRQDRPTTVRRAAVAGKPALRSRGVPLLEDVGIVVCQLLTRLDVANRLDPDTTLVDHGVTVWIARVVDEPRFVAVHGRVDHDVVIDRE